MGREEPGLLQNESPNGKDDLLDPASEKLAAKLLLAILNDGVCYDSNCLSQHPTPTKQLVEILILEFGKDHPILTFH